jgi:hypothetical protein
VVSSAQELHREAIAARQGDVALLCVSDDAPEYASYCTPRLAVLPPGATPSAIEYIDFASCVWEACLTLDPGFQRSVGFH